MSPGAVTLENIMFSIEVFKEFLTFLQDNQTIGPCICNRTSDDIVLNIFREDWRNDLWVDEGNGICVIIPIVTLGN